MQAIEKGRCIYAGIQKFIAFIMSVHFAEVLQIFLCIVTSIPVMRQPLQILFLILVTDLPPSIALGFEPPEDLIMKRKPRPRTQPVVMMWMWRGIVANGLILTVCIFCTYMLALWAYAGAFTTRDITNPLRDSCTVWKPSDFTPTLDFQCSLHSPDIARWKPCSTKKHMDKPSTPNKGTDCILNYLYFLVCMCVCMYLDVRVNVCILVHLHSCARPQPPIHAHIHYAPYTYARTHTQFSRVPEEQSGHA